MTASGPPLPHFIVIGAMKCGTTTLYRHLSRHPGIVMSRDKEPDFFVAEKAWSRGREWYGRQFSPGDAIRGEASPNYAKRRDFPGVPERMASLCPDARLVYILRDPVDRAESQFRHGVVMGDLDPDLADLAGSHEYEHILDTSRYAHQLDAYLDHFPRDAVLVLDFDDLRRDPQSVLDRVHAHIGAAPSRLEEGGRFNDSAELARVPPGILRFAQSDAGRRLAGMVPRAARDRLRAALARGRPRVPPPFPDALRSRIRDDLAPDAERLRALTGQPFPSWSV